MANIVQNAVGTQRQFTKQPVATYQKSIRNLTVNNGLVNTGVGERLHQTLLGLGEALMNYANSEEDRKRANVVRVNRIINSMSDEDMKTLKGMDLLNKYGEMQLADNPYAVAAIEQARGKYFSDKFNQYYAELEAKEPVKTPQEARERYMSEKRKFLEENEGASYNLEGFYNGFWASNLQDVSNITNQKTAEISKEMKGIRDGEVTASFDKLAYNYSIADKQDPDALFTAAQELVNSARVMQYYGRPERAQMVKTFVNQIAQQTGSLDLVKKLGDLVIDTNDDGSSVLLKDAIAMDDSRNIADQVQLAKPNQYTLDIELKLANCKNKDEVEKLRSSLPKEAQNRMTAMFSHRILEINDEEKRKCEAAKAAATRQIQQRKGNTEGGIAFARWMSGHADGSYTTADNAYAAAAQALHNMTPGDTETFAKILFWPSNTTMRKEYAGYFKQGLLGKSPSEMEDVNNPQSVTNGLALWNYNPAVFAETFGNDLAEDMQTVQALIDYEGSQSASFQLYCQGRDNMARDSTVKDAAEQYAGNTVSSSTIALQNANDPDHTADINMNDDVWNNITTKALTYARAAGLSEEAAAYQVSETLKNNYVEYDDHPIPRVVFAKKTDSTNGIDATSDQLGAATKYMNYRVAKANAENPGCTFTWWWGKNNRIHFGCPAIGFDEGDGYSLDEFYDNVNVWSYEKADEEAAAAEAQSSSSSTEDTSVTSVGSRRATYSDLNWDGVS
nr:hypothetical protein JOCKYQNQ_JOCKYQNQ_CDS_0057 [Autographiviridae sp.]